MGTTSGTLDDLGESVSLSGSGSGDLSVSVLGSGVQVSTVSTKGSDGLDGLLGVQTQFSGVHGRLVQGLVVLKI